MPTHFSQLEGSPSNRLLERRRRRRGTTAHTMDEQDISTVTAYEPIQRRSEEFSSSSWGDDSSDIPHLIRVQNWRRLGPISKQQHHHHHQQQQQQQPASWVSDARTTIQEHRSWGHHRSSCCGESGVSAMSSLHRGYSPSRLQETTYCASSTRDIDDDDFRRGNQTFDRFRSSHRNSPRRIIDLTSSSHANRTTKSASPRARSTMENRHYFSSGEKRTTTSFRRRCPLDDAHTTTIRSIDSISTHTQTTTFRDKYTPKLPLAESTQSVVEEPCRSIYFHRDTTSGDQSKTGLDKPQHFAAPSDSHNNNAFTTVLSDDDGDANNNKSPRTEHDIGSANHQNTEREETATQATKWLCDVCKEARFDSYVEAFRHELECKQNHNNNYSCTIKKDCDDHTILDTPEHKAWRRQQIQKQLREMGMEDAAPRGPCRSTQRRTVVGRQSSIASATTTGTTWLCSICRAVSFDRFSDACRHERMCQELREREEEESGWRETRMDGVSPRKRYPSITMTEEQIRRIQQEATADLREGRNDAPSYGTVRRYSRHSATISPEQVRQIQREATADLQEARNDDPSYGSMRRYQQQCVKATPVKIRSERIRRIQRETIGDEKEVFDVEQAQKVEDKKTTNAILDNTYNAAEETREPSAICNAKQNPSYSVLIETMGEMYADRFHAFKASAEQRGAGNRRCSWKDPNNKGEAYDRYVRLASEVDDEEEKARYIALAKKTREEELWIQTEPSNDERYVCLA